MKRYVALLAITSLLASSGCSFILVRGPGDVGSPPRAYPECTEGMTWPIVDGVFGVLFALAAFGGAQDDDHVDPDMPMEETSETEGRIAAGLLAVTAGVSAFVGYQRVSKCKTTREAFVAAYPERNQQPFPLYYTPGQQPPAPQSPPPTTYYPPPQQPAQIPAGYEGGACLANSACGAPDLVCASGLCVRPPSAPTTP